MIQLWHTLETTKKELKQMYYDMVAVRYDFSARKNRPYAR